MTKFLMVLGLTVCVTSGTFAASTVVTVNCKNEDGSIEIKVDRSTIDYSITSRWVSLNNGQSETKRYEGKALFTNQTVLLSTGEVKFINSRLNLVPGRNGGFDIYLYKRQTGSRNSNWIADGIGFEVSECTSKE